MSLSDLSIIERNVSLAIISDALAAGLVVSVYDGEEWSLRSSSDKAAIGAVIGDTCETRLTFRNPAMLDGDGRPVRVGWVWLVHGNGCDVISDYSDNAPTKALLRRAEGVAEASV